jgi:hypothetical protein
MPMLFLIQQCQKLILTLLKKLFKMNLFIFIGIFYPYGKRGEPISLHLLRCDPFAIHLYSSMDQRLASAASLARE